MSVIDIRTQQYQHQLLTDPLMILVLRGEKATVRTQLEWPCSVCSCRGTAGGQATRERERI